MRPPSRVPAAHAVALLVDAHELRGPVGEDLQRDRRGVEPVGDALLDDPAGFVGQLVERDRLEYSAFLHPRPAGEAVPAHPEPNVRATSAKMVVVDAIDDAAATFYEHHEFVATPDNPKRLTRKLSTIARALDLV